MSNGKMFGMLRAMDAYERRNAPAEPAEPAEPVTCHTCGAAVDADALAMQTAADGSPRLERWYCATHLIAGLERLKAAIWAPAQREGEA